MGGNGGARTRKERDERDGQDGREDGIARQDAAPPKAEAALSGGAASAARRKKRRTTGVLASKPDSVAPRAAGPGHLSERSTRNRRRLRGAGRAAPFRFPIRSCSGRGLPCAAPLGLRTVVSCTAVSPLLRTSRPGAVSFLWHFPFPPFAGGIPHLPARTPCPAESGLSSGRALRPSGDRREGPGCHQSSPAPFPSAPPCRMRPQKPQVATTPSLRASTRVAGESVMWHPPQAPWTTPATPQSPHLARIRS